MNVNRLVKGATVNITLHGLRRFRCRLLLGAWVVRIGFWIIGMRVRFETGDESVSELRR